MSELTLSELTDEKISEQNTSNLIESVYNVNITWDIYPTSVILNLPNKDPQILKVGDFITHEGRQGTGVIILEFIGYEHKSGPNGFIYIPWRDDPDREHGRWGSRVVSLRGDLRFVICPPVGLPHYGLHINWFTVEVINHMAPTSNFEFQKKLNSLQNPESN